MQQNKQGFTLIELLVVVLIIGILAAVALPQYNKAVEKSRASEAKLMLKAMDDAQQVCVLEQGDYDKCQNGDFFENSSFTPPTEMIDDEDCLSGLPCFRTKDWEYWSEDILYAQRIRNGEKTGGYLAISTAIDYNLDCSDWGFDGYCSSIGM